MKKYLLLTLLILSISPVLAFDFPHTVVTISYDTNITNMSELLDSDSGSAADGEILVWNAANGLWEPSAAGGGDILGVTTNGNYLTGGDTSGTVDLLLNETYLNNTITTIATGLGGGNASFNQTLTDSLYAPVGYGDDWNKTYADTLYAAIGAGADNSSWNESYANTLYILTGDESNLNVNSSDYWDTYNTANTTWFENIAGVLSLKLSELSSYLDTWLGTKDTDDLTEGSTNLYDNRSWNESRADSKYALIGAGADNESWNESYANTLYAPVNYGDDWNKTYADTLYSNYSDSDIDGNEDAFDGWDKDASNDFDGSWNSLTDIPAGFSDGIDNQSAGGADWTELTSVPAGFADDVDNDTTYTAGTNLTLDGTEFQLDTTGLKAWLDTLYSAIGSAFSGSWNDLTDIPAGFSDGVDNDTTYSDLSEFNNDVGYFDEESDLTALLDDNYADIAVTGDNSSWNESYANTLYAPINYGDDWNKTYADTLYADISVTGGSNFNQDLNTTDDVEFNSINASLGTYTNLTANSINSVLYVEAGNGSDIQAKIDLCDGINLCYIKANGNYSVTSVIQIKDNLILDFTGAIIYSTGLTPDLFNGSNIDNFKLIGGKYNGNINGRFININNGSNIYIKDVDEINTYNTITLINISNIYFTNNKKIKTKFGVLFRDCDNGKISSNEILNTTDTDLGINIFDNSHDLIISNNVDNEGISVQGTYDVHPEYLPCYNLKIIDNEINGVEDDGISVWGTYNSEIIGNKIIDITEDCIIVRSQQSVSSYNINIQNNFCNDFHQFGIQNHQDGGTVMGNVIINGDKYFDIGIASDGGYNDFSNQSIISDNEIRNVGIGIQINDNNAIVKDNYIKNCGSWGIRIQTGNNTQIIGNVVDGLNYSSYSYGIDIEENNATIRENIIKDFENIGLITGIRVSGNNSKVINNEILKSSSDYILDSGSNNYVNGNYYEEKTIYNTLTFALSETIDNLIDGWLRITGSLDVQGDLNVTGTATIANLTMEDDINMTGNNMTSTDCIVFNSGGKLCSGA